MSNKDKAGKKQLAWEGRQATQAPKGGWKNKPKKGGKPGWQGGKEGGKRKAVGKGGQAKKAKKS